MIVHHTECCCRLRPWARAGEPVVSLCLCHVVNGGLKLRVNSGQNGQIAVQSGNLSAWPPWLKIMKVTALAEIDTFEPVARKSGYLGKVRNKVNLIDRKKRTKVQLT